MSGVAAFFAAHPSGTFFFSSPGGPQPKVYEAHLTGPQIAVTVYEGNRKLEKAAVRRLSSTPIAMTVEKLQLAVDAALAGGGAVRLHPEALPVHDDPQFSPGLYTGAW